MTEYVTEEQLEKISRHAVKFHKGINETCEKYDINNKKRICAFLAQVAHESGGFYYVKEIWGPTNAQKRYEGRSDLGNYQAGDGKRYMGHGLIQITGRHNHKKVGEALGQDFEANPELLMEDPWAVLSAGWYWNSRRLNKYADAGKFKTITKKINGGLNGYADRLEWHEKIWKILD